MENNIALKPVILFKNDRVENSKNNQNTFNAMLENLSADDISNFYNMIGEKSELFKSSLSFFKKFYGSNYINKINPKFFRCNLYMDGLYMERYSHNSLTNILQHHKKNYKSIEEFENAELYHKPIKLKSFNDNLY